MYFTLKMELCLFFFLSQSSIVFLFQELSTNYILIQTIISSGITICNYILQIHTSFAVFVVGRLLQNVFMLMQKLAVIMLTY